MAKGNTCHVVRKYSWLTSFFLACQTYLLLLIPLSFQLISPLSGFAEDIPLPIPGLVKPTAATTSEFLEALKKSPTGTLYGLADFSRHLSQLERKHLTKFGLHVLEPYYKNTYWVRLAYSADSQVTKIPGMRIRLAKLIPEDRVDPKIWKKDYSEFSFAPPGHDPLRNYVLNTEGTLNLSIRFHADVTENQATKLLALLSKTYIRKNAQTWHIVASRSDLLALANEDIVQWIAAGPQPLIPENDHTRAKIGVNIVQRFDPSTGQAQVSGAGIRIGIFDLGIDETHQDFGGRIIVSSAGKNHHATAMAGIVAASGISSLSSSGSPYQWRGMAPEAQLYDEPTNVGDDSDVHRNLIKDPGMQLSNHSYLVNNKGEYTISDRDRDDLIKGIAPHYFYPRLHIYSAGNYGCIESPWGTPGDPIRCIHAPYQTGYFSLTKQLKNGLIVGNWNHAGVETKRDQIYHTSSLGPTHDGRIKPDVVAPGTDIRSTRAFGSDYGYSTGTSSAAAAITGSLALLLEEYKKSYNIDDLNQVFPLPSTLRALVIHTADDVTIDPCPSSPASSNPWFENADGPVKPTCGPDFVTGWGLVNVEKARSSVTNQLLLENTVEEECETRTYSFDITSSAPVRVTLAWDDVPYSGPMSPSTLPKLMNDLDLILIDPSGQVHYPWKLDQTVVDSNNQVIPDDLQKCSMPIDVRREFLPTPTPRTQDDTVPARGIPSAVRGKDHLNNVEVVDAPSATGTWKAQIIGFSIHFGPQPFSLVGYKFY